MKNEGYQLKKTKLGVLISFAIAMGFLESAVVIYLRGLWYPGGFCFPLAVINEKLAYTELLRELATVIMLISIGWIAGRNRLEKFAIFLLSFGIWDLSYYLFLKLILDWPASFFTWDILFLIPVTWTGPVLAPVISSLTMIPFAILVMRFSDEKVDIHLVKREWLLLVAGAFLELLAFVWDYSRFMLNNYSIAGLFTIQGKKGLFALSTKYLPVSFPWFIFILGEVLILIAFISWYYRLNRQKGNIPN